MIIIGNIKEMKRGMCDETYAIVRSWKGGADFIEQMAVLSPSRELFFEYRRMVNAGTWNEQSFKEVYVPRFIQEMKATAAARKVLNDLYRADKEGKRIGLCCFCADEKLCHRSIIAGLLQAAGADVRLSSGADYSAYYDMYRQVKALTTTACLADSKPQGEAEKNGSKGSGRGRKAA